MIQLLFEILIALSLSYFILRVFLKYKIKIRVLLIIGFCFYMVEIAFFVYQGTRLPVGTTPVTPEEIVNPR